MPNFYVTRKVGRLKNFINPAIPPVQATEMINHLKTATRDLSSAVFDAWNLLIIHHQRQASTFLDQCRQAAAQHFQATGHQILGDLLVPDNATLEGCGSDQM
ncbi:hypothetical protein DFS34DRAFT_647159 [Phlyctochytrium arcticum]|nr:hypothetical protein DFS34DRAFT_647159 [Phlyctochytrium arcticum]